MSIPDYGTSPTPPTPPPTREPLGIVLGLCLMVLGFAAGLTAMQGGWFVLLWPVAVSFVPFGLIGFTIDVRKVPRDSDGKPLR